VSSICQNSVISSMQPQTPSLAGDSGMVCRSTNRREADFARGWSKAEKAPARDCVSAEQNHQFRQSWERGVALASGVH